MVKKLGIQVKGKRIIERLNNHNVIVTMPEKRITIEEAEEIFRNIGKKK